MLQYVTMLFPSAKGKAMTISCDDGRQEDGQLLSMMKKYGIKGAFNLSPGIFHSEHSHEKLCGRLSKEQLVELYAQYPDIEIASHGLTHPFLAHLPEIAILEEIFSCRNQLEKIFGKMVRGLAYPYGSYSEKVKGIMEQCGVVYGRTTAKSLSFNLPADWKQWDPTCNFCASEMLDLADAFLSQTQSPTLFYLWGHASDMSCFTDGWGKLEKCFERLGNREDIWYATGIEIYDYVQAFERLVFSADGGWVYNPSGYPIWYTYRHIPYDPVIVKQIMPMEYQKLD